MIWMAERGNNHLLKKRNLLILSVVISGVFVYLYITYFSIDADLKKNLKSLYELANPGTTAEVLPLIEDSGLLRTVVKLAGQKGDVNYVEVWITKDARLLTQSVIFVKESVAQMGNLRDFVNCLHEKDVRIYGVSNQTISPQGAQATLLQLNALGLYSPKIYVDCGLDLQICLDAGVTQVPSIVFNGSVSPGSKSIPDLEKLSGCKFG